MSITTWLSVGIFAALVTILLYYKLSERGRRSPARLEAFVMIAIGLLNMLAGDISNVQVRGWMQWLVMGSGALALLYGLYLLVRGRFGRDTNERKT